MIKGKVKCRLQKAIGFFCAFVLLIGALYVPLAFSVSAANIISVTADETVTFGFEDTYGASGDVNTAEFEATGVGYCGWGTFIDKATDDSGNNVLVSTRTQVQTWATSGALRVNKKVGEEYQVYNLEPSTRYIVSLKVRVISSSQFTDDAQTAHECYVSMGYGARKTGSDTNYVSSIYNPLVKVVSTKAGSGVYTLATDANGGKAELDCGTEWQTVTYEFTTPADLGKYDHALAFYGTARTAFRAEIDDLSVIKLGENTGVLYLVDEYSGKSEMKMGEIGTSFTLPDISDRAQQDSHKFGGWYIDEARTESIEEITYSTESQKVYSAWTAPVTVTFVDEYNETSQSVTGVPGESFNYPADPVPPQDKWFDGWYTSKDYTTKHTSGVFGYTDTTLYAYFDTYKPFERVIDYSAYTVKNRGNSWSYTTDSEPYQSVVKDESASGGAYLHFHCDANTAGSWYGSYTLTLTASGNYNSSGTGDDNVKFPENTTYRATVRMRTNNLSGRQGTFFVSYGVSFNSALNGAANNYSLLLSGVEESDGFETYELLFTTPAEYNEDKVKCFLGFTVGGNVELDYDIDDITIQKVSKVELYTVENGEKELRDYGYYQPGEYVDLPDTIVKEVYSDIDNTAEIYSSSVKGWYTDEELTLSAEDSVRARNSNTVYYADASTVALNTDNQIGFCGFDLYKEDVESTGIILDSNITLSDTEAYTGKNSLAACGDGVFEIRNDDFFPVTDKTTYNISFAYKADKDSKISLGFGEIYDIQNNVAENEVDLSATSEWKTLSVNITADFGLLEKLENDPCFVAEVTTNGTVYIDTVTVSSVVGGIGALKLKADIAEEAGSQALRFMFAYKAGENANEVYINGEKYTVAERGILLKNSIINTALTLENTGKGIVKTGKTGEMENCWSYNSVTKNVIFSTYVKGLSLNEQRKISARGYVVLSDGSVYYGDEITVGLNDIIEGSGIIGEDADLVSSDGYESMNDYFLYLPEGTEIKGEEFKVVLYDPYFMVDGNANPAFVSEYVMEKASYVKLTAKGSISDLDIYVPSDVAVMVEKGSKEYLSFDEEALKMSENIKLMSDGAVNYIFITDLHHSISSSTRNYMIRQMNTVVKIANENDNIDFIVVGGDVTTGMFKTKAKAIENTQDVLNPLKESKKPVFVLTGNHDDNSYHIATDGEYNLELIISDYDWSRNIIDVYCPEDIVKDSEYADSKYYYYDMPEKKTRLVFFDTIDCRAEYDENGVITALKEHQPDSTITSRHYKTGYSYWGYDMDQVEWFANEALTAPDDWNYVYISHMGIDGATNSYGNSMYNSEYIRGILAAYQNKTTFESEELGTFDFSNTTGKFTMMSFGHQHTELVLYSEDIDLWQISTACANIGSYEKSGAITGTSEEIAQNSSSINTKSYAWTWYYRKLGTPSQSCFDVISANENKVMKFAFGCGSDRVLYYK